jgi:hypothetical protein
MFKSPNPAPVDRLIRNVEAYLKENPKDAQGYYALGRIHYLAYSLKSDEVATFREGDANKLPALSDFPPSAPLKGAAETELPKHVAAAIINFRKAIELEPNSPLYHQGLAWILEEAAAEAAKVTENGLPPGEATAATAPDANAAAGLAGLIAQLSDKDFKVREAADKALRAKGPAALPAVAAACRDAKDPETQNRAKAILADWWKDRAIESYYTAYSLAISKDLAEKWRPLRGLKELVAYEAGGRYVALVAARGPTEAEKERFAKVQKDVKTLEAKPEGAITPIIFHLGAPKQLAELLAAGKGVKFDLDGTGRNFTWPWVKPDTGILVWDPKGQGKITSGHQLFGSVTWNIFWADGYSALDALDDNRDGELSGEELRGLAVWHDRNGNGVSDEGEVTPIERLPIRALRTRPTGRTGETPFASDGLRTLGGGILPTYDWTTRPLAK